VYMVAVPKPEDSEATAVPAASPGIHLTIRPFARINPRGVLLYVVGMPLLLLLGMVLLFRHRRRSVDHGPGPAAETTGGDGMLRSMLRQSGRLARVLSCVVPLAWLAACVDDTGPSAPPVGAISVTTSTTGVGLDPDGYRVIAEGGEGQPIGINETLMLLDVTPRAYSVQLTGVAENCVVQDGATQTILVEADATAELTFAIVCSDEPLPEPPVARLTITDPNAQSVTEDGRLEIVVPPGTFATFTFDAGRSEAGPGSSIEIYEWQSNGVVIDTRERFDFALDEGEYLITLKVTDGAGLSETASATIIVSE
ncbi:MAG: PKD domain-containing protein, partial [Gemmatimonadales bacterium]